MQNIISLRKKDGNRAIHLYLLATVFDEISSRFSEEISGSRETLFRAEKKGKSGYEGLSLRCWL